MRKFLFRLGLLTALMMPQVSLAEELPHPEFVAAAASITPQLQTGTLLFSEGDCLAVRVYTASQYTHVALVCIEEGEPFVYDSMNGVGVRRLSLAEYFASQAPHELHVLQPCRPLTAEQGSELQAYLSSQLGRPYSIHHHLTGKRADGVHCSEYATDALMAVGLITAQRPPKVSPASLATGVTQAGIYAAGGSVDLVPPAPTQEPAANRCHQWWLDTKQCTISCCQKLSGWFLCR
jgi:hypothetical protein